MATVILPAGTVTLSGCLSGASIVSGLNLRTILVQGGGQVVTNALDQSGLVSGLTMIDVQPGSSISIQSSAGGALKATVQSMIRLKGSGGTLKYTPITTGGHSCDRLLNIGGNNVQLVSGSTAPVVKLEQNAPGTQIDVDDSTLVTTLVCVNGSIDQQYNATGNTSWYISGGSLTTGRGWSGTARIGGGQVSVSRTDNNITSLPSGATLEMGGGSLQWRGGNITTINCTGGMLDFRYVPKAMTISTLVVTADVVKRSFFKSIGATNLVTISSLTILGGDVDSILQ